MIPAVLHRTVPAIASDDAEYHWSVAGELHPGWDLFEWRDPLDPADFPLTSPHWWRCGSGAQFAGLIRLEVLHRYGGFYLDSDFELYRPLHPLRGAGLVAAWQDAGIIPDAFLAATPQHPCVAAAIELAISRLDIGAHASGPDVITELWPQHGALLLPPQSIYPYHYTEKSRRREDHRAANPWAFGAHHWAGLDPGGWAT